MRLRLPTIAWHVLRMMKVKIICLMGRPCLKRLNTNLFEVSFSHLRLNRYASKQLILRNLIRYVIKSNIQILSWPAKAARRATVKLSAAVENAITVRRIPHANPNFRASVPAISYANKTCTNQRCCVADERQMTL